MKGTDQKPIGPPLPVETSPDGRDASGKPLCSFGMKMEAKQQDHACALGIMNDKGNKVISSPGGLFAGERVCIARYHRTHKQKSLKRWLRAAALIIAGVIIFHAWKMGWLRRSWVVALWGIISSNSDRIGAGSAQVPASLPSAQTSQPLVPFALQPLPLGTIEPRGWLADNLELMANGLAGHLHEFYSYVASSSWLGGSGEYSALHEGFPYWLNGIVPLAYSLNDARLKTQISTAVNYVLSHQYEDGWLGPEAKDSGLRNLWARYPLLLGFTQLLEADWDTYATKLLPAMRKFVDLTHSMLANGGSGMLPQTGDKLSEEDHGWGRVRVGDMLLTMQWLYEHDEDGEQSRKLLETMDMLRKTSLDWAEWYTTDRYIFGDLNDLPDSRVLPWFAYEHGVNVAQGLKAGAVINRFERNDTMVAMARRAVDWTFKYHGSPSGTILADERLEGLAPYYGAELCTTVEAMYSLSYLYQSLGDSSFADRAELAAFNALPAAVMGDWWAHQYLTQPNQPYVKTLDERPFWNVNGKGTTFGLEPNYPCCTVNHPQGYPKFLAASWVLVGTDGLGHALLSPSALTTTLKNGANVSIEADTNYPFTDTLYYTISSSAPFTLHVRIPGWADMSSSTLSTPTATSRGISPDPHTRLLAISLPSGKSFVTLVLSRSLYTIPRANGAVAIMHGPLLYTLDVGFDAKSESSNQSSPHSCKEWEIENTKKWNVAVDTSTLKVKSNAPLTGTLPNPIWDNGAPPTSIEAQGCEIEWPLYKGVPGAVPQNIKCTNNRTTIRFVPVGSAKIGMVELPTL